MKCSAHNVSGTVLRHKTRCLSVSVFELRTALRQRQFSVTMAGASDQPLSCC
jgi:hypothetical protein